MCIAVGSSIFETLISQLTWFVSESIVTVPWPVPSGSPPPAPDSEMSNDLSSAEAIPAPTNSTAAPQAAMERAARTDFLLILVPFLETTSAQSNEPRRVALRQPLNPPAPWRVRLRP